MARVEKAETPKVRGRFDRMRVTVPEVAVDEDLLTQQQFKDECDMNLIVANAMRGIPPKYVQRGEPRFGDFTGLPEDLSAAYELVEAAEEAFMSLPAALREELGNDPTRLNDLTPDQISRYKLGPAASGALDDSAEGTPLAAGSKSSAAGQAAKAGTEPAESDLKGRAKKTGDS